LNIIHIAGTKGKGSTSNFCELILRNSGLKTGIFTSPHLVDVRERIKINGFPVEQNLFIENFWKCWNNLEGVFFKIFKIFRMKFFRPWQLILDF
jgi:folylpolyglutamate synthase